MKILIKPNMVHIEQLDILLQFSNNGHLVKIVDRPLYLECTQDKYDVLIVSELDLNDEIKEVISKYNLILLSINEKEINIFTKNSKNSVNWPRLANIFKYKTCLPSSSLESEIYIHCTDLETAEFAQDLSRKNKKIKVSSSGLVHCSNFVGVTNPDNIVKLAKSSKITLSNNNVLINSLLYLGIPTFNIRDFFGINDEFDLESYVLSEKKLIQSTLEFLTSLNEIISNLNR